MGLRSSLGSAIQRIVSFTSLLNFWKTLPSKSWPMCDPRSRSTARRNGGAWALPNAAFWSYRRSARPISSAMSQTSRTWVRSLSTSNRWTRGINRRPWRRMKGEFLRQSPTKLTSIATWTLSARLQVASSSTSISTEGLGPKHLAKRPWRGVAANTWSQTTDTPARPPLLRFNPSILESNLI